MSTKLCWHLIVARVHHCSTALHLFPFGLKYLPVPKVNGTLLLLGQSLTTSGGHIMNLVVIQKRDGWPLYMTRENKSHDHKCVLVRFNYSPENAYRYVLMFGHQMAQIHTSPR